MTNLGYNFSKHTSQRSSNAQKKIKIYLYSTYQQRMHRDETETLLFLFLYFLWSLWMIKTVKFLNAFHTCFWICFNPLVQIKSFLRSLCFEFNHTSLACNQTSHIRSKDNCCVNSGGPIWHLLKPKINLRRRLVKHSLSTLDFILKPLVKSNTLRYLKQPKLFEEKL